jgi:intracellular multiplication protein IcmV
MGFLFFLYSEAGGDMFKFVKRSVKKSAKSMTRLAGLNAPFKMAKVIFDLIRKFLGLSQEYYPNETFEEAIRRLGYSPQKCLELQKAYFKQALLFFACALGVLCYAVVLMMEAAFLPAVVTFLGTLMLFTYAFRSHFSYFQLKNRKLGCSLSEWINASVKGTK